MVGIFHVFWQRAVTNERLGRCTLGNGGDIGDVPHDIPISIHRAWWKRTVPSIKGRVCNDRCHYSHVGGLLVTMWLTYCAGGRYSRHISVSTDNKLFLMPLALTFTIGGGLFPTRDKGLGALASATNEIFFFNRGDVEVHA